MNIDDLTAKATAALEERAILFKQREALVEDQKNKPGDKDAQTARRLRIEAIDADIDARGAEAEDFVRQAEREAENRAIQSARQAPAFLRGSGKSSGEYRFGEAFGNELRAVSGASGLGAAFTPGEFSNQFFDRMRAQSVLLASGVQVIPTERDMLTIPRMTGDATTNWVSEGATITATDPTGDTVVATPRKLANLTVLSSETISDSNPAILERTADSLAKSLALKFDLAAFEGSGTAPEIRGLKNVVGITSQSMGGNGAQITSLDPIADAMGGLLTANSYSTPVIVMHPRTWQSIIKIKEATGSNKPVVQESWGSIGQAPTRTLYGAPVFLSSQLSITDTQGTANNASSIYVYDPSQVVVVVRKSIEITTTTDAYFTTDQVGIRAIARMDLVVPSPAAVVRVVGIIP